MKFLIGKKDIENILDLANEVVLRKSINPVLSNILLETYDGVLKVTATDSELTFIAKIEANIIEDGDVCVINSTLRELVKAIQADEIIFEKIDSILKIYSENGNFKANLKTFSTSEFPTIETEELENAPTFAIKGFIFKDMITKNIPFAAKDEVRYNFISVFIEKDGLELRTISSDTRRLALAKTFVEGQTSDFSILIPLKTAKLLKSMLKDSDLEIKLLNKRVGFIQDNITVISNQIEGDFPNYKAAIPQETEYNIIVNKLELENGMKILNPFFTTENQKINFIIKNGAIKIVTDETEMGEGEYSISTDYDGNNIEISFNYNFIKDIITTIDEDNIMIKIKSNEKPVIFKGKESDNYLFVTVPSIRSR
ncbi:MAG TPA: DNA polymerase III subunit beta [Spirochaetota bacterium]|nr:DNA polymerase III subunit beta [Spirochaetota bacterium]HOM39146.1 DNA polymerase III subunit beta [Spirochaetota bacterium]HPQ48323.1 DNA polymerase III subunit beta [Spirochaetota bacterium]